MNYLTIVNNVLRRLRETQVTSIAQTPYSALIGDFVNDAKTTVDSAWKWSQYRVAITQATAIADKRYSVVGTGSGATFVNVINDTSDTMMTYKTPTWFDIANNVSTPATGSPVYYTFRGTDSNGDVVVEVYPIPDAVYSLIFNVVKDPVDLEGEADNLYIPHQPVIQLAYGMALRERGETGGQSAVEQFAVAETFLSDAISLDAAKNPEELLWRVV